MHACVMFRDAPGISIIAIAVIVWLICLAVRAEGKHIGDDF